MEESNVKRKAASVVETITPEIAREYLKFNINNRPLKPKVVDYYAEQMRKGQWLLNGEAICFAEGGGMINGQHRLNAIIKAGVPVDIFVARNCDPNSFYVYDSGVNRTIPDIVKIKGIPNHALISSIVAKYFTIRANRLFVSVKGFGTQRGAKGIKKSALDVVAEIQTSPELYQDICRQTRACVEKLNIFSKAEVGGFWAFLVKDKNYSFDTVMRFMRMLFWSEGVTNDTINVLREKVVRDKMNIKSIMTPSYKQAILIKTWNAYITRKELKTLTYNKDKEGNLVIL